MKKINLAILIIIILTVRTFAFEPFLHNNQIISMPTAYSEAEGTLQIAYNSAEIFTESKKWSENFAENISNLSARYSLYDNLELGLSFVSQKDHQVSFGLDLHYQIFNEAEKGYNLAFGFNQLGSNSQDTAYVVASKLIFGFDWSVGFARGNYFLDSSNTKEGKGLMFGVKKQLGSFELGLDYDGKGINMGGRYHINDNFIFNLAVADLENMQSDRDKPFDQPRIFLGFTFKENVKEKPPFNLLYNECVTVCIKEETKTELETQATENVIQKEFYLNDDDLQIIRVEQNDGEPNARLIYQDQVIYEFYPTYYEGTFLSGKERALIVRSRIYQLIKDKKLKPIEMSTKAGLFCGYSGDYFVFTITAEDIKGHGKANIELAQEVKTTFNNVLVDFMRQ